MELWRQCGDWLSQLQVLPPNHSLARIECLVYTLRDGVILCNILATLDPQAIDMKMVNLRPQMARSVFYKLSSENIFWGLFVMPEH